MPVDPNAEREITAYSWVPPAAQGLVRDLRARWALEEAGLPYRERLFDVRHKPDDYVRDQPFCQVPAFRHGAIRMFESGAITLHVAEQSEVLLPRDPAARARAVTWLFAALDSVEPALWGLIEVNLDPDAEWSRLRRPIAEQAARKRLGQLSASLGDREWLDGSGFTAGDLMMATVLRILRQTTLLTEYSNLAAYKARCEARPAFRQALADQLAAMGVQAEPNGE